MKIVLAIILVAAGAYVFWLEYNNLNPVVDGKRPEVIEGSRTEEDVRRSTDEGENPVARMMGETGPYAGKMGAAAGQLLAGVVLIFIAYKVYTYEKSSAY